jgi:Zn-dependent protease with chaperone function
MAVGYWVAGEQGMIMALLIASAMNFVAYWTADRAVLGLYGALEVDDAQVPGLMRLVRELASRAGLPMPRVLAISRTREYSADRTGAQIVGQPMWLANALGRIDNIAHRVPNYYAERNPATAHLFIVNPLSGTHFGGLFSTHPPVEDRIARLAAMAQAASPWSQVQRRS